MEIYGQEADIEEELTGLVEEVNSLFNQQKSYVNKPAEEAAVSGYQPPIKGTFYNSGGFSLTSPNPRHPQGHMGVDMRASSGTAIYPMAPGVVTNVGTDPKGGNIVNIQHANNVKTYYAHMATAKVHKGDKVGYDTVIGTVGNTGNANQTWPHLHFQVWQDGQIQDPARFFSIPKYTNVDKAKEKWWASDEAKEEAQSFNMKKHVSEHRVAFTNQVNKLSKITETYYHLTTYLK